MTASANACAASTVALDPGRYAWTGDKGEPSLAGYISQLLRVRTLSSRQLSLRR
jgi:hypothetical protein